jgi:hypothetical protein
MTGTLHALRRASVVAGRPERREADVIFRAWGLTDRDPALNPEAAEAVRNLPASLERMMGMLEVDSTRAIQLCPMHHRPRNRRQGRTATADRAGPWIGHRTR